MWQVRFFVECRPFCTTAYVFITLCLIGHGDALLLYFHVYITGRPCYSYASRFCLRYIFSSPRNELRSVNTVGHNVKLSEIDTPHHSLIGSSIYQNSYDYFFMVFLLFKELTLSGDKKLTCSTRLVSWCAHKLFPNTCLLAYFLTYLLTELSPSWEAANCAVTQELLSNLWNPKGSSPCLQEPPNGPYP
jgi:hypothetical protein